MKVRSTATEIKSVEILSEKVYLRKNIARINEDGEEGFYGWEYEETEFALEQYLSAIEVMGQQITNILLEV